MIFEPDLSGHHANFVRLLSSALCALPVSVTIATTPEAAASTANRRVLLPELGRAVLDPCLDWVPGGRLALARLSLELGRAARRLAAEHVYVPYADGIAQLTSLTRLGPRRLFPRDVQSEALLFRAGAVYPSLRWRSAFARRMSFRAALLAPFDRVHHLDPYVFEAMRREHPRSSRRWSLVPDPVVPPPAVSKPEARRALALPNGGRVIACVGVMDVRKGVDRLLRAFAQARLGEDDRLLLAGPHDRAVRSVRDELFGRGGGRRVVSLDEFVEEAVLEHSVQAADLVCAPYPRHMGSASVVLRAAAAERPVLGSEFGWIGRTISDFDLGWTSDVERPAELARALELALTQAPDWRLGPSGRRFVEFHSEVSYQKRWTSLVRERLGMPPEEELTWDWVRRG